MSERDDRQLTMWRNWKSGDNQALDDLLTDLRPIIKPRTDFLTNSSLLPRSAVSAHVKVTTIRALEAYDPERGASIGTHVISQIPKANRFIMDHASAGRIPEHRRLRVSSYISAQSTLQNRLGREPTTVEMMDELQWPEKDIRRLRREIRKEVSAESLPFETVWDHSDDRAKEALEWLAYDLTPEESKVFEHRTGWGGADILSNKSLAKRMKKSEREVRSLRESVADKLSSRMRLLT